MGSPRRVDSYHVCELFRKNLTAGGEVEFKYMFLKDLGLEFCRGCGVCTSKDERLCPARDVTQKIEDDLLSADAVILASPVYAQHITALMKNFIDHSCHFFHRPRFFDKAAIILATTGGTGADDVLNYLNLVAVGWGFNMIGKLGVVSPLFRAGGKYKADIISKIRDLSGKLLEATKTKKWPAPSFYELVLFNVMKKKARTDGTDNVNYKYWDERGWFDKNYYRDTPVNPVSNLLAKQFSKLLFG